MLFSSLTFLYAFLPLCLLAYALCRTLRQKNIALLVASLVFYAWGEPKYVLLLVFMSLADWFIARCIDLAPTQKKRKLWLVLACVVNLALIGFFKYSGLVWSVFGPVPEVISSIALPLGISFYTFQLLSYVVDVYRGDAAAQEDPLNVLLYAALFHQCIAGPIVRYKTIAEELFVHREALPTLSEGVKRFAWGLGKKVLLANACGSLADSLLLTDAASAASNLAAVPVTGLWLGMAAFMLQIYLDFSAYSDMAIGLGLMLGLHYPENFDHPYMSHSITEFWRRWHISLGAFFRDYVYIPLGGARCGRGRLILNLLVVWALTGLWHGASWNFVLWGLYYFVFLVIEKLFLRRKLEKLPGALSWLYTVIVVFVGWTIFKFTDLQMLLTVLKGMFGLGQNPFTSFQITLFFKNNLFILIASAIFCTPVFTHLGRNVSAWLEGRPEFEGAWKALTTAIIPVALLLLSTAMLVGGSYNPFIYFHF